MIRCVRVLLLCLVLQALLDTAAPAEPHELRYCRGERWVE